MAGAPRRSGVRRWLWPIALVAGMAVVAIALLPLARPPAGGPRGGLVGQPAPPLTGRDGAPLDALDGSSRSLDQLRGSVVWINFWSTWCIPCRTEMPAMDELADRYAADGLIVLGIDVGEGRDTVAEFVAENRISYPILLDFDQTVFDRYSPQFGLPRHFFVGRDGRVTAARIGELPPDEMEPLVSELLSD